VIEPEHALEHLAIDAAEHAQEQRLVERSIAPVAQRVLGALQALHDEAGTAAVLQLGADAQRLVRVDVVVARLERDAEQQIADRAQRRALAGGVPAVDQVQAARRAAGEIEAALAERPESHEIEPGQPHA
jgi:hypothetical protein